MTMSIIVWLIIANIFRMVPTTCFGYPLIFVARWKRGGRMGRRPDDPSLPPSKMLAIREALWVGSDRFWCEPAQAGE